MRVLDGTRWLEKTGVSLDPHFNPRAFVRQNGVLTDLNSLTVADTPLYLLLACSVNSRGEIVGLAADSAGEFHAYIASPSNTSQGMARPIVLPESARKQVREHLPISRFLAGRNKTF